MRLKCLPLFLGLLLITAVVWAEEEEEDGEVDVEELEEKNTESETKTSKATLNMNYKTPVPTGEVYFAETFDGGNLEGWVLSKTKKEDVDDDIAKYDGRWTVEELKENQVSGDKGLVLKSKAKHHAISALLKKPFVFNDEPLIVQYEVNFQNSIDCGGAYLKLLSHTEDQNLEAFFDKTPYSIMFGPDKCGEDYKLHFIFRHKNPQTGDFEEKHAKRADVDLKKYYTDKKTHLYTLVLKPDNSFEMLIDQYVVNKGNMLEDMTPPINPSKEIDDPNDQKPEDWDEDPKIADPDAVKPEDWDENAPAKIVDPDTHKPEGWLDDEPEYIPDPNAPKPEDWDEEMDGEWEPPQISNPKCEASPGCGVWEIPMISNPNYKGKWKPPLIDNPKYQGVWNPRKILNPDYFEDLNPFKMTPFSAVGLELWSMTSEILFDNFIICSEKAVSDQWAADGWALKKMVASANEPGVFSQLTTAAEERPWLWIIYALTAVLPLGLIVLFCWPSKKTDSAAEYKKSDAVQPDVKEEQEPDEEEEEEDEECEEPTKGKEAEEQKASGEEDNPGDGSQEEEDEEASKSKSASEDEMREADEGAGSGDCTLKLMRKKKVRKE
ncbi:calnexin isoform X1 [Callorhinchus milii]|uniref:Calmegin n=1 Tax=Callorhinchus milii TaxID=7868 RepID=V9KD39_CALMI|nr:calnexin isoform X1 [Callorhinchus milii]XP_007895854.1 calnexin isoform X1 [Callorhinchus milii]XP_007895855.1 calnexin isoform X1 [Callorhinchus milii]XP_007895856.1 calnexin isoform X1 [Callorhinchus milii]XP_007895858.1 calnexin isoform X1 [Callorhinchus milii]|eukprot:gi/632959837/ref/XP_007895853.1/ PREDICTED: calmegin isoform X1 [Callorhinchus milii]